MGDIEDTAQSPQAGSDPADPRIDSVVGRHVIVRLLGKGGMGAVYEARHLQLNRRFAIKFLLPEFAAHREVLARFEAEAKAAGGLEHPNLIAVTDVGRTADGAPYLVMEFLKGEDCSHLLERLGPLPVLRATDLVLQACRGLAVAHEAGIVHRDLKPENLFVTDAGDGSDRVKVLDFGIAQIRSPERSRVTRTGATLGTAYYMSPEQARAAADLDSRTDVWSLGVVLYELLSGRKPFEGERFLHVIHQILSAEPPPLATLCPGIPRELVALVERAMAKDATARLPSVVALADGLAPFAGRASLRPGPIAWGPERTRASPPTARRGPGASGPGRTGMTAAKSDALIAGVSARSTAKRWAAAGLVAAAVIATGMLAPRLMTHVRPTPGSGSAESPAPLAAQRATEVRVGGSAAPAASALTEPLALPLAPSSDGGLQRRSEPSEPSEPSSNKSGGMAPGARMPSRPVVPVPALAHPPSATSAASSEMLQPAPAHRTKIDRANPY